MVGAGEGEDSAEEQEDGQWKPEIAAKTILVEVAFATPSKQLIVPLTVPIGTTAYQAVVLSNIKDEFDEIDLDTMPMGIFSKLLDGKGRPTAKEYVLQIRDRVEIYRPLTIDPMQARLNRAETAKKKQPNTKQSSIRKLNKS
jgi:putative ubiquitin-RnfH superfamily antitoxin RatB of RatAB toxin-antitoxin module